MPDRSDLLPVKLRVTAIPKGLYFYFRKKYRKKYKIKIDSTFEIHSKVNRTCIVLPGDGILFCDE